MLHFINLVKKIENFSLEIIEKYNVINKNLFLYKIKQFKQLNDLSIILIEFFIYY